MTKTQKSSDDKRKIVAVDLDDTLTIDGYILDLWKMSLTDLENFYISVKPRKDIIEKVNKLYDKGCIIYIFSSRWDLFQHITKHWLKQNCVKFHYITLNKAYYDILIDDKATTPEEMDKWLKNL